MAMVQTLRPGVLCSTRVTPLPATGSRALRTTDTTVCSNRYELCVHVYNDQ